MVQRVIFGRAKGEAPDPADNDLTPEERAMVAEPGHDHGHGHAPAVSGGSHDHDDDHPTTYPDMNKKELITILPLAALTILVGVYPKIVFDYVEPTFQRILAPFL
jgi:hypothetical protein